MRDSPVAVAAGAFSWRMHPDLARCLGPAGIRLQDWLRSGAACVVKQGPHRVVYRVTLPGITFYLKHNRTPDCVTWFRQLVRSSKARREYAHAREALARGIATAEPLAWAQQRGWCSRGESFLATRSLEQTQPLNELVRDVLPTLPTARQARLRRRLAEALGSFLAHLHSAGIRHNDLHAGNLLVQHQADDAVHFYLIDLNSVRFGTALTWRQSMDNLTLLNHWFIHFATRSERLRFLCSYLRDRPLPPHGSRDPHDPMVRCCARHLEEATWRSLHGFWQHRDRRFLANNRYFRRLRARHATGHAVTDLDADFVQQLLADPDAPFRRSDAIVLKDSRSSTVVEFSGPISGRAVRMIYKRFRVNKAGASLGNLVRMPPALRSWRQGHGFHDRQVPTPRPLLVLHRRRRGLLQEGYLLAEKVENAQHLQDSLDRMWRLDPAARRRWLRASIDLVAQAVRELHRRQISQRDLKAPNILLADAVQGADGRPQNVWFLDLVGVQFYAHLPQRRRLQNLARLNASFHARPELTRTDRLRFLRCYMQWGLHGKQGWKSQWRALALATDAKLTRNARVGRMVA